MRAYLARAGYSDLDAASFARWRRRLRHCAHNTQVDWAMIVYRFCRYRRRRENRCFLPQRWTLGRRRPYSLPTPINADQVRRLLDFVCGPSVDRGVDPCAHAAHRLAIVLLYTAGLRRGEAARLRMEDVDAETGVVRVCGSKFHKSRWVPLSASATAELRAYLRVRATFVPRAAHNLLLCSCAAHGYTPEGLSQAVRDAMCRSGIWAKASRLPRVHDFRHAFAVAALRRWYEEGRDVQSELPKLSMYMGHVSIASTTYYLRFMPAVVTLASERFATHCGALIDEGGAP